MICPECGAELRPIGKKFLCPVAEKEMVMGPDGYLVRTADAKHKLVRCLTTEELSPTPVSPEPNSEDDEMASFNQVILIGNLTRDPEMRFTPSGLGICGFGIAVNRKFKDTKTNEMREEVTFVDIEAFGKTAEAISKYLQKGAPIMITGRLKLDQWDDKQTGQKRSKLKVICEQFQFLGSKKDGEQQQQRAPAQQQQRPPAQQRQQQAPPPEDPAAFLDQGDETPF